MQARRVTVETQRPSPGSEGGVQANVVISYFDRVASEGVPDHDKRVRTRVRSHDEPVPNAAAHVRRPPAAMDQRSSLLVAAHGAGRDWIAVSLQQLLRPVHAVIDHTAVRLDVEEGVAVPVAEVVHAA